MEDRYGALWADRYGAFPRERVKRSWAEDLASFIDCPDCFRAALKDAIDECKFPPTLPEFVALCRKHYVRPQPKQAALPDIPPRYTSKEEGRRRLAELKAKFPSMKRVLDEVGAG